MKPEEFQSPQKAFTRKLSQKTREQRAARRDAVALEAVASGPRRNDLLPQLRLEQRPVDSLRAPARAVRTVNAAHVTQIARSISAFGMIEPILISENGQIIDGVSTLEAARSVGLGFVPCLVIDHLTPQETRILRLALNRLQEKGEWDVQSLKLEFQELIDLDAPFELAGFEPQEIDIVLLEEGGANDPKANSLPVVSEETPSVSRLGDLWKLGRHRVLCADATKPESYTALFDGAAAAAVFTDPPYNIKIDGFAVGAGSKHHREFLNASGEMTDAEFVSFLTNFLKPASCYLVDGSVLFVCMDWRHAEHVEQAARKVGLPHLNTAVWVKGNGGLGGLYRSAHEFVLVFRKGVVSSVNNVELGRHGRDRSNVWTYPGSNQRGSSANAEAANHPTPKPVELVADALLDVTERGDIVLDPFAGSGTTIIAAQKTGRTAYTLELDPSYVDLIIRRFEKFTGEQAVHAGTGRTFAELMAERLSRDAASVPPCNDEKRDPSHFDAAALLEDVTIIKASSMAPDPLSAIAPADKASEVCNHDANVAVPDVPRSSGVKV
jgi:DNA modification methylase